MYTLDQTTLTLISALGGLMGAIGGTFAAIAAYHSAGIARKSVKLTREAEHAGFVRNVLAVANTVLAESLHVDNLSNKLIQGYETLFAFGNRSGSAGKEGLVGGVKKTKLDTLTPLQEKAREIIDNKNNLRSQSREELMDDLIDLDGCLGQIKRIQEQFDHALLDVERQIQTYRERAITTLPTGVANG
ncbi:MAG: hypothetical protein P8Z00_23155 [Anaerolineales bacterium]|jgi:hypothetical protein